MKFLIYCLIIIVTVVSQPVFSVDDEESRPKAVEVLQLLRNIQNQIHNRSLPVCLPGFVAFGGSCYFLSPIKTNWLNAAHSCALKRNGSLATFETTEEMNFLVDKLMKIRRINQAFIGLRAHDVGQWSWLDGRTFWNSVFGPLFYVYRPETARCGLINLVNQSQLAIEGRDCSTDEAHFLCKYVQNHCHGKDVCGRGGECMNIGLTFQCRCHFFYRGRKCERLSSKAVQSFVAVGLMVAMSLLACFLKFDLYERFCKKQSNPQAMEQFFNEQYRRERRTGQERLVES